MSLLFKMLSKSVIDFLPRRKRLLISRLQSPSAVILEPQKIKSLTVSIVFPSICHEVPPVNSYNKRKRLTNPFQRLALPGDVLQDWRPFCFTSLLHLSFYSLYFPNASPSLFCPWTLVPHCFSLSNYKRCWHPDPNKMFTLRPSSQSASFPGKVIFLASTPHLSDSLAYCARDFTLRLCEDHEQHYTSTITAH